MIISEKQDTLTKFYIQRVCFGFYRFFMTDFMGLKFTTVLFES